MKQALQKILALADAAYQRGFEAAHKQIADIAREALKHEIEGDRE